MIHSFSEGLIYFLFYSMVGWVCEVIFCSIQERRFVNRGFLHGPYCPVYGFGALAILLLTEPFGDRPVLVFLLSMIAVTLVEYFTSWLLEKLFQMRWWDYSDMKFQIGGRVCLPMSLLFGVMGYAMRYLLHPITVQLVGHIMEGRLRILSNAVIVLFLFDLLVSLNNLVGFTQRLQQVQAKLSQLRKLQNERGWYSPKDLDGSIERLRQIYQQDPDPAAGAEMLEWIDSWREKHRSGLRLLRNYPKLRAGRFQDALDSLRDSTRYRGQSIWQKATAAVGRLGHRMIRAAKHLAGLFVENLKGLGYHQLFWIFLIAGVIGYVVETIYCLVATGRIESRQGLIYGPFNQIYGFGAAVMVIFLAPLAKKNDRWLFAGSALLGGGIEVLCSLIQEKVFGSISWDYSGSHFSIAGGRTSLLFMFFWGILGLFFIKAVYPWLRRLIQRIPARSKVPLTALLTLLLCFDMLLSGTAVIRWAKRAEGEPPSGRYELFLDRQYPDEVMRVVYPNLLIIPRDRGQ